MGGGGGGGFMKQFINAFIILALCQYCICSLLVFVCGLQNVVLSLKYRLQDMLNFLKQKTGKNTLTLTLYL